MTKNNMRTAAVMIALCALFMTQTYAGALTMDSKAQVEFQEGMGPTYPVDPDDPDTEDGGGEPALGSLAIVKASSFHFGNPFITTTAMSLEVKTNRPNIQVVDLRGTAAGWKLTADMTSFTGPFGESLQGAELHIKKGRPNSISTSDEPTHIPAVLTADGEPVPVIRASSGAGTGLWVMCWYQEVLDPPDPPEPAYITLELPAGSASIGAHIATIDWVLEDTP